MITAKAKPFFIGERNGYDSKQTHALFRSKKNQELKHKFGRAILSVNHLY